jgi:membrane protein YdbS with pleckstrin-like domain
VKDGRVVRPSAASAALTAAGPDWQAPSRALLRLRQFQIRTVGVLVLAAGIAVVVFFVLAGVIVLAAALALYVGAEMVARRRYLAWGYAERDEDLLVRRGVLVERLSVVPYGRMQFVDVVAGPLERRFGLATVRLHTAAAASDARVPGLPADEAERLRDRLAMLGESRAAGL